MPSPAKNLVASAVEVPLTTGSCGTAPFWAVVGSGRRADATVPLPILEPGRLGISLSTKARKDPAAAEPLAGPAKTWFADPFPLDAFQST